MELDWNSVIVGALALFFLILAVWIIRTLYEWQSRVDRAVWKVESDFRGNDALWEKLMKTPTSEHVSALDRRVSALEKTRPETDEPTA